MFWKRTCASTMSKPKSFVFKKEKMNTLVVRMNLVKKKRKGEMMRG